MHLATRLAFLLILLFATAACEPERRTGGGLDSVFAPGALSNPSIGPIGGGEGYAEWVDVETATFVVDDLEGLLDALVDANPDDARIDVSDVKGAVVPVARISS